MGKQASICVGHLIRHHGDGCNLTGAARHEFMCLFSIWIQRCSIELYSAGITLLVHVKRMVRDAVVGLLRFNLSGAPVVGHEALLLVRRRLSGVLERRSIGPCPVSGRG